MKIFRHLTTAVRLFYQSVIFFKDVKQIVEGKRILLFKAMLKEIRYDDVGVADLLVTGVRLVGDLPRVGIWRPNGREARCTSEMLWASARRAQAPKTAENKP